MASVPLQLEVNNQLLSIDPEWISRWKFLIDYTTEEFIQDNVMRWTYSSENELKEWIQLNEDMDGLITLEEGVKYENKHPLSSVWRTVDFMTPTSLEYLRVLYIDEKVIIGDRKRLYAEIGLYTRITRNRTKKNNHLFTTHTAYPRKLIHSNFSLYLDPIYEYRFFDDYDSDKRVALTEEQKDKLLSIEWVNVLTGIMVHTLSNVSHNVSAELPWDLMPWIDVLDLVPCPDFFTISTTDALLFLVDRDEEFDPNNPAFTDKTYYALAGRTTEEFVPYSNSNTTRTISGPSSSGYTSSGVKISLQHYPLFLLQEQNLHPERHTILHTMDQTYLSIISPLSNIPQFYDLTSSYNLSLRPNRTIDQLLKQIVDSGFSPVLTGGRITDFAAVPIGLFNDQVHYFYPLFVSSLFNLNALYRGKLLRDKDVMRRMDYLKVIEFEESVRYCAKTIGTVVLGQASELLLEYYGVMENKDEKIITFVEIVIKVTEEVGTIPFQEMP